MVIETIATSPALCVGVYPRVKADLVSLLETQLLETLGHFPPQMVGYLIHVLVFDVDK